VVVVAVLLPLVVVVVVVVVVASAVVAVLQCPTLPDLTILPTILQLTACEDRAKFNRVLLQLLDAAAQAQQIKWPEGTTL
jgi:hypothetical protein